MNGTEARRHYAKAGVSAFLLGVFVVVFPELVGLGDEAVMLALIISIGAIIFGAIVYIVRGSRSPGSMSEKALELAKACVLVPVCIMLGLMVGHVVIDNFDLNLLAYLIRNYS